MFSQDSSAQILDHRSAIARNPLIAAPEMLLSEASLFMTRHRTTCTLVETLPPQQAIPLEDSQSYILVMRGDQLVGIVTERDLVRLSAQRPVIADLTLGDVMTRNLITLRESEFTDLFVAITRMQQHHIRHLPVFDEDDRLVGVICQDSIQRMIQPIDLLRLREVSEVMVSEVVCANPADTVLTIAQMMTERTISSVVLIEECTEDDVTIRRPIGIITECDLVQMQSLEIDFERTIASQIASQPVFTVLPTCSLWSVQQTISERRIRRVVVADERGNLCGIVTQTTLLKAFNPFELYQIATILENRVLSLEAEKTQILAQRNTELEELVQERTQALQFYAEREQWVAQITQRIRASLRLQDILDVCVAEVRAFLGCDRVLVYQFQADWSGMMIAESVAEPWRSALGDRVQDTCWMTKAHELYRSNQPILMNDVATSNYASCHQALLAQYQVKANLLVPINIEGKLWGILICHQCQQPRVWQDADIKLLRQIAVQFELAIEQATMHQSLKDELWERQRAEAQLTRELYERQRAEARLRVSRRQYASLAKAAPVGIFQTDAVGMYTYINAHCEEITGLTFDRAQGHGWIQAVHPEDWASVMSAWEATVRQGEDFQYEYRFLHQDGAIIWAFVQAVAERDRRGQIVGYIGTIMNITDRRETAVMLRQTLSQLEQLNQELERKVQERTAELLDREQFLQTVLDTLPLSVFWKDRDLKFLGANRNFLQDAGLAQLHELIGKTEADLPWGSVAIADDTDRSVIAANLAQRGVIDTRQYADGSMAWVEVNKVPLRSLAGEPIGVLGMYQDITQRKESEQQLSQQMATIEAAFDGIAILKQDRYIYLNSAHLSLFGYEHPDELMMQSWRKLYEVDECTRFEAEILPQLQRDRTWQGEAIARRKDGSTFSQGLSLTLTDDDLRICVCRDISPAKDIQKRLQHSAATERLIGALADRTRASLKLDEILQATVEEVYDVLGTDRVLVYQMQPNGAKRTVAEAVAADQPSLLGQIPPENMFPSHWYNVQVDDQIYALNDRAALESELSPRVVKFLADLNIYAQLIVPIVIGQTLWGFLIAHQCDRPRHWQDWEKTLLQRIANHLAIAIQQVTLFDRLQQQLIKRQRAQDQLTIRNQQLALSNEELARATRLKDEFLANMSHELRTPLNAILGMAEGLQAQVFGAISRDQGTALETIERSGEHLLELIDDILDLAKIESGKIELELDGIDVLPLCTSSLTFIRQQALKKRITLKTEIPNRLPRLWVDERRIRQVLINLLNNAVKFTPEGGGITLQVTPSDFVPLTTDSLALISIADSVTNPAIEQSENAPPRPFLRLSVSDTGIGIAAEHRDTLFEPFVQIESSLARKYTGTGLGLSLVQRIVSLHGGRVSLDSEVGVGSCFSVDLPCVHSTLPTFLDNDRPVKRESDDQNRGQSSVDYHNQVCSEPTILIVEDNLANLATFTSYLQMKGYHVLNATSGQAALEVLQVTPTNLILMDIQMPDMDGLETTQRIRQDLALTEVPIVALTALAMPDDRDRCLAAGATEYLTKPIKLKKLATILQDLLSLAEAR
jgi:PAS domain S-box-containing protein